MTTESKHRGHKHLMGEKAIVKSWHTKVEKRKLICLMHLIHKNILYIKSGNKLKHMPSGQRYCGQVENNLNSRIATYFKSSEEHS